MQRRGVINQRQPQLLKYDYASQANEIALITNMLGYASILPNKTLFPDKRFSPTIQGVSLFHFFDLIYILTRAH